jgi:histidinol-phosphatase (PHP family)
VIDLHTHTWRCRHACGTSSEYLDAARSAGVRVLAFTDHLPLSAEVLAADPAAVSYAMPEAELAEYVAEVRALKERSARTGGPEVLVGIEADLHPGHERHVAGLLTDYSFDVVLGSVHYIDGWAFDDPDRQEGYAAWGTLALWERYFSDVAAAARSGLLDVVSHLDLVKKFGFVPESDLTGLYDETARTLSEAGVTVELNTAGLRKPCAEIYPGADLLAALVRHGVPLTVGSDAHSPADVGAGWREARRVLEEAGVTTLSVFRGRRREEVAL